MLGTTAGVAQGLPGGATSLNETHGDWTVNCVAETGPARCMMVQVQVDGETRQRVLSVQLSALAEGNAVEGMLVLPFGLRLDAGVKLAIEPGGLDPVRFSTCLPVGCVAPLAFDAATIAALRSSPEISIEVVADDTGQNIAFGVSLTGFASALERLAQLGTS